MAYKLITIIVNRGFETAAMDAARLAGATGGTFLNARGAGAREAEKAFGIAIQPEKEILLVLSPKEKCDDIMRAVVKKTGLTTTGSGICFTLPVSEVLGVTMGIDERDLASGEETPASEETPAKEKSEAPAGEDERPAEVEKVLQD